MTAVEAYSRSTVSPTRWIQLGLGLIAMMAISSPQYVWTLFVKPFQTTTGGSLASVQITFSLLIVLQTWLSPLQGWLIEKFGARVLITLGCLLSGLGWVASSQVTSLTSLYLSYGLLCGVGTGIVYIGIVGLMLKWFPDRRGLAAASGRDRYAKPRGVQAFEGRRSLRGAAPLVPGSDLGTDSVM